MKFNIDGHEIGGKKIFFIAEIGNNHNGDLEKAKKLIDIAKLANAQCVKFQMRDLKTLYRSKSIAAEGDDLGSEYILDLLKKFELSTQDHYELFNYCNEKEITYMCTPWDEVSLKNLEEFGVSAYKVASADLTNIPLIEKVANTKKPIILSTGMSTTAEVEISANFLRDKKSDFALLHCNSTYPAPLHDINLEFIKDLKKIHPLVGYSGHERGIAVSLAACALGACIIERHITLDRKMEGPDHTASLEKENLVALIDGVKEIEQALGEGGERKLTQGEMINRENLSKSLIANEDIKAGEKITKEHIKVQSPGQGISPQKYHLLLGKVANRNINNDDFFFDSDITGKLVSPSQYKFDHKWGIPVRFHDFQSFEKITKPDLFEFHLSYSDLDLQLDEYLSGTYDCDFVVHAPELFKGSHLMDLATPDESYRAQSIKETQRVIDLTYDLKRFFPKTECPKIVANIGGISTDKKIKDELINNYYETFADSLKKLNLKGTEIIPQTMAPYPWHFGGQRYQNLFVRIDEIVTWCNELDLRMCFDVSHSMLACNEFNWDFYDFATKIAPITAHLHLGDAEGNNGEGLQIGDGEIDFNRLCKILNDYAPESSFIPEIWQGHKNGGQGFWLALEKLNNLL